jgi:hypothetical protein
MKVHPYRTRARSANDATDCAGLEAAVEDLTRGGAAETAAILRSPCLGWGPYCWLSLEDVPLGVLFVHERDPDEPAETREAIRHELMIRLEDLQLWAKEQEGRR